MTNGAGARLSEVRRLDRQRRSGLLTWCCAVSAMTLVVMVPPLGKMLKGVLLDGPEWLALIALCAVGAAIASSLYFFLAVVLHLTRSRMGAVGKAIWGVCLLLGGTVTAVVYFLTMWPSATHGRDDG